MSDSEGGGGGGGGGGDGVRRAWRVRFNSASCCPGDRMSGCDIRAATLSASSLVRRTLVPPRDRVRKNGRREKPDRTTPTTHGERGRATNKKDNRQRQKTRKTTGSNSPARVALVGGIDRERGMVTTAYVPPLAHVCGVVIDVRSRTSASGAREGKHSNKRNRTRHSIWLCVARRLPFSSFFSAGGAAARRAPP